MSTRGMINTTPSTCSVLPAQQADHQLIPLRVESWEVESCGDYGSDLAEELLKAAPIQSNRQSPSLKSSLVALTAAVALFIFSSQFLVRSTPFADKAY